MYWKGEGLERVIISILCTYSWDEKHLNRALNTMYKEFSPEGRRYIKRAKHDRRDIPKIKILEYDKEILRLRNKYIQNGYVVNLGETERLSCCLECLERRGKIREHAHRKGFEIKLMLENDVITKGQIYDKGSLFIIQKNVSHYYMNPFFKKATLFSLTSPPWAQENMIPDMSDYVEWF